MSVLGVNSMHSMQSLFKSINLYFNHTILVKYNCCVQFAYLYNFQYIIIMETGKLCAH